MRLRTKYILLITILHLTALVLSFYIFQSNPHIFIGAEFLIFISAIISWQLYEQMLKPLQTIVDGIEAIKSKDFNVKFLHTGSPEMDRMIDVYNEMMVSLRTERSQQEQQHFFLQKLLHTSPTGTIILDYDGHVQQINPKACTILGINEKSVLHKAVGSIDIALFREISELKDGEGKTISPDGVHTYKLQRAHFVDRGFPRSFIMIEELTAEIIAAEKKAYGKVIRMMAHEVNNTIGPVNSILDSALKTKELWTKKHEILEGALQVALQRNQNLNIFMRNFAHVVRLPLPNRRPIDINNLALRIIKLFEFKAQDARIQIAYDLPELPFTVSADEHQLEQVMINIIKNSMEAIEADGKILVSTNPQHRTLTITDSGSGISNQNSDQLFSPFFSTKKNGQGVGLTLVKEILINHGFTFSLRGGEESGAVFMIEFNIEYRGMDCFALLATTLTP